MSKRPTIAPCITALLLGLAATPAHAAPDPNTTIDEIVMYGVDADTNELLRYVFDTDTYQVIGKLVDEDGDELVDIEGLAYIPAGPAKGLYCVPTEGDSRDKLAKIDPVTAEVQVFDSLPLGATMIDSMISRLDPDTGDWYILAVERSSPDNLVRIDPMTGTSSVVVSLSQHFSGLAEGPGGTIYASLDDELFILDIVTGVETEIGEVMYDKIEALEYAFGDAAPTIDVPGVPAAWTSDGVLFGFSDAADALLILDPATGDSVDYPCTFTAVDCEGLVFVTRLTDPYYAILAGTYD